MAVDRERYKEYKGEVDALRKDLSLDDNFDAVESKLLDYLAKNDVDPEDTLRIRTVSRQLLDDELEPFVDRIFSRYEDLIDVVNTLYDDLGVDVTRDLQRVRAIEHITSHELGEYKESTVQQITRSLRKGLFEGDRTEELIKRIMPASKKARLYGRTIAQTHIKAYGRAMKAEKARIAEVEYYEYVGVVRPVTRPFCRWLVGTTHHVHDIRKMSNGNRDPVLTYCGGWNCVHDWEPDPFAKASSDGEFVTIEEGSSTLRLRGDEDAQGRYEEAKELNRKAAREE